MEALPGKGTTFRLNRADLISTSDMLRVSSLRIFSMWPARLKTSVKGISPSYVTNGRDSRWTITTGGPWATTFVPIYPHTRTRPLLYSRRIIFIRHIISELITAQTATLIPSIWRALTTVTILNMHTAGSTAQNAGASTELPD